MKMNDIEIYVDFEEIHIRQSGILGDDSQEVVITKEQANLVSEWIANAARNEANEP